ncbi:MAG: hypothetical protein H0U69_03475 [Trueperaceae bacterium]|nr:hypothetical protein [Trueperaceae bacterium]
MTDYLPNVSGLLRVCAGCRTIVTPEQLQGSDWHDVFFHGDHAPCGPVLSYVASRADLLRAIHPRLTEQDMRIASTLFEEEAARLHPDCIARGRYEARAERFRPPEEPRDA